MSYLSPTLGLELKQEEETEMPKPHRRHRSSLGFLAVTTVSALTLTACGGGDGGEAAGSETETLSVNTMYGPEHYQTQALTAYTEAVTEASDDQIQFEFHYAGSLAAPDEVAEGLSSGLIDIAHMVPNYSAERFPTDDWISAAGAVSEAPQPVAALQSASATLDWSFSQPELMAEYRDAGIEPLLPSFMVLDDYGMLCKEEVTSLEDASGKRVRTGGTTWANEAEAVGMVPEQMVPTDVYEAFQRGVLDCIMAASPDLANSGYWEVGKEYTDVGFSGFSSYGVFASQDRLNSLSEEHQTILWENLDVFLESLYEGVISEQRRFVEEGSELGVSFNVADEEFQSQLADYQNEVVGGLSETAPDAISDPAESVDRLLSKYDTWEDQVTDLVEFEATADTWHEWVEATEEVPDLADWADSVNENVVGPNQP